MTHQQQKSAAMLAPLLGEYLATKLAIRHPAVLIDQLALALRRMVSEAERRGRIEAHERWLIESGLAEKPATPDTSGN